MLLGDASKADVPDAGLTIWGIYDMPKSWGRDLEGGHGAP